MIHNKYTMTLSRLSQMMETGNVGLMLRWGWLPGFVLKRRLAGIMAYVAEMFNADALDEGVEQSVMMMKALNLANNLLPSLYFGLLYTKDERYVKEYENRYGKKPEFASDLREITKEIERLARKIKALSAQKPREKKEPVSLEKIITNTEAILDRGIDRNMKLYQFKEQYDLAVKRAREYQKMMDKRNGGY